MHALLALLLLLWAALQTLGPWADAGTPSSLDGLQRWRVWASAPDPRLLIVDIDEPSLAEMAQEFGRWPWPRDTLATVLAHAQAEGATALVFDILFSDADRLHPGGDQALAAAVRASRIGFFPVARLPQTLDAHSRLTADRLPGLALPPAGTTPAPTVAVIAPFMDAMVRSGRLGSHTIRRDADGALRRFAFSETLPGGWRLQSMPAAVAAALGVTVVADARARPIVWRRHADAYPRVPFARLWACAEGRTTEGCPALGGRILVLGASATSLHDVHATPLSNQHAGIDVLATLVDNALHQRAYAELPPAGRLALAAAALALAWAAVRRGSAGATRRALLGLPALLLVLGWASLHTEAVLLDLALPAGLCLSFLSTVALHDALRARLHGVDVAAPRGPLALACGAPAEAAERLERAVMDEAAAAGLRVSGGPAASGDCGCAQALWVVWALADHAAAAALADRLRGAVPGTWNTIFEPGPEPQRALHRTVAATLPGAPLPSEVPHAT
ncbi:MAG: CHASE2 domain-containing protein [Rubrivivax sp.]